jgi:hypothetical protein
LQYGGQQCSQPDHVPDKNAEPARPRDIVHKPLQWQRIVEGSMSAACGSNEITKDQSQIGLSRPSKGFGNSEVMRGDHFTWTCSPDQRAERFPHLSTSCERTYTYQIPTNRESRMQTEVGIFNSRQQAEQAIHSLLSSGIPESAITVLAGEDANVEQLPTTDTEADGMGKTMTGFLGGAAGLGAGFGLGTAAASMLIPGIGPVIAVGVGAAALLGAGGAAVGATLGDSNEAALDQGSPKDDVFLYHELLGQRKVLVLVNSDSLEEASGSRRIFDEQGSENIERARSTLKVRHDTRLRNAS